MFKNKTKCELNLNRSRMLKVTTKVKNQQKKNLFKKMRFKMENTKAAKIIREEAKK